MKDLEHIIFEQIIFTYQDHTGFEEKETFNQQLNDDYIKCLQDASTSYQKVKQ